MPVNLFLEQTDMLIRGAYSFEPKHCIDTLKEGQTIDAVYFPYMINGGFLNPKITRVLLKRIPQQFIGERLEYEYVNGQVPKYLCNNYRHRLAKTLPSLRNKPLVFLHIADFPFPYETDGNTVVVRCSVNRSTLEKKDIVMPARIPYEDWKGPQVNITSTIGFCGCPHTNNQREQIVQELHSRNDVKTNFFLTPRFYNHLDLNEWSKTQNPQVSDSELEAITKDLKTKLKGTFIKIMDDTIFSFCQRGRGNYSVRFYETLRAGRIPVMVDSDQVFPCEDIIDWDDIIICAQNTEDMLQKIQDWIEHRDLIEVQKRCREVWEKHLHFPAFIKHLPRYIEQSLS